MITMKIKDVKIIKFYEAKQYQPHDITKEIYISDEIESIRKLDIFLM